MNILFIGDIVGLPGREAVKKLLPELRKEFGLGFVIANAENAAGGSGITQKIAYELFDAGVDVLTSGDHIWKKREIVEVIKSDPRIMRPANFPENSPGRGYNVFNAATGIKVGVINVQGRVFMEALDCPFKAAEKAYEALQKDTKIIIVDIHAEATSEKVALGWYLDGKVSAVLGTHTHIQTNDLKILDDYTAFITDAGMTGPYDNSIIGVDKTLVLKKFLTGMPVKFELAKCSKSQLNSVIITFDGETGAATNIEHYNLIDVIK